MSIDVYADGRPGRTDLTVIMCAFNEADRVGAALQDFLEIAESRPESFEIIVVDNGSTDGTREILSQFSHPNVNVVLNEANLGKGGSIKKAISLSTGAHVVIHDPDLEYESADVWKLLDTARAEGAHLTLGSRVLGGSVSYKYLGNYLGVRFLTWAINVLFRGNVTDSATAMKLLDGDFARSLDLRCSGFDLDFELVAVTLRLDGKVVERRVEYHPRTFADGKKLRAYKDGFRALTGILRTRLRGRSSLVTNPRARRAIADPSASDGTD